MTDIMNPAFIDPWCEPRAITFESPTGARGAGGRAADGRKGAPSQVIGAGERGVLLAAPYTTSQYTIAASAPLEQITVTPPADALLGQKANRTNLTSVLFCSVAASLCRCPPGDTGTVPPSEPMTFPASLGISGNPQGGTTGSVTAIPLSVYCTPKMPPTPNQGADGGTGGDPHMIDFSGGLFDFQQAGEFTLVHSTHGRPRHPSPPAAAVQLLRVVQHGGRDAGRSTPRSRSIARAPRGFRYMSTSAPCTARASSSPAADSCRSDRAQFGTTATVTWPDGTMVKVFNAGGLGSGVLDVSVALAGDQLGHVAGLLGDAGGSAVNEFHVAERPLLPGRA